MSLTNNALEAWRWWETARDDLRVAETLSKEKMYALPDLTPSQTYTREDAHTAIKRAKFLLEQVRLLLPSK